MKLLLVILAIIGVYLLVIALINVIAVYATSPISNPILKYSIRTITAVISPFWLYVDMAIGLPLLKAACRDSGTVIHERFSGDRILVNEGTYSDLPSHTGPLRESEFRNLTYYFTSPWGVGRFLSSNGIKTVKTFGDDKYAEYWIADLGSPFCLDIPMNLRDHDLYKTKCIAIRTVPGKYEGYVLKLKPFRETPRTSPTSSKRLKWGLTEYRVNLEKHGDIVAFGTTYKFEEWLKVPTPSHGGEKSFYCRNQKRDWDYIEEFISEIARSN